MFAVARSAGADRGIELSIVIPAFDEAYRLPVVLEGLRHHIDRATTEIVVVDDGSSDGTADLAEQALDWAHHAQVVRHDVNRGKGAAVRTGVERARGRMIGFVDADNATDLDALDPMVAAIEGRTAAVFGSRHAPGSSVTGSPLVRGVMGRVFNHVVRLAAGTSIRDTQCGAKVFWGPAARVAFAATTIDGFAFDVEVLRRLLGLGVEVAEHPVQWHYVHGTKIRTLTPLRMLRDIVRIRLSRPDISFPAVETTWHPDVARLADPLLPGSTTSGEPCSIVFLPEAADEADAVAARLAAAGLEARRQSLTWAQLTGTSAS